VCLGEVYLDVLDVVKVALDQQRIVAEGIARLGLRRLDRLAQRGTIAYNTHALTTATGRCLQQDREADLERLGRQGLDRLVVAVVARNHGDGSRLALLQQSLGMDLVMPSVGRSIGGSLGRCEIAQREYLGVPWSPWRRWYRAPVR